MSLNSIMSIQKQRKNRRTQIFKDIFEKVKIRIIHYTKFGQTCCHYQVPYIIYGLPHVNLGEIVDYLENNLKDEGFVVVRMNQISIYISWEETVINEQIRINTEKIKLRKHEKDMDLLEDNRNKEMLKSLVSYD